MRGTALAIVMVCLCAPMCCLAQRTVNALFVGNSYTDVNNLPSMVQQMAASTGDHLTYQSNTPGGCTFNQHCNNRSMELICNGGWDIVVLQEQSQYPSFPQWQVESQVFPYAQRLVDSAYAHSPCCEPMFYMTWGRKNGDSDNAPFFPVLGTYEGMDSMLCERYTYMARQNDASLCPVGRVWRYLRENHPDIELYQSDESHPSLAGTYAAACAFHVLFFHRDPIQIAYDASLPESTARTIREAVRVVVYERLAQWQRPRPEAGFSAEVLEDGAVRFTSAAVRAAQLEWHFGDGTDTVADASLTTLVHHYADTGAFTVSLVALRHCMADTFVASVYIHGAPDTTVGMANILETSGVQICPNPAADWLQVSVPAGMEVSALILYSADGREVRRVPAAAQGAAQTPVPLAGLPSGLYLLRLETPKGAVYRKVAVNR